MILRSIFVLLIVAVATANQMHLPIAQVFAWAGMLVSYSRDADVVTAFEMTFDGEHPCPMCNAIKAQQVKSDVHRLQPATPPTMIFFLEKSPDWFCATYPILSLLEAEAHPVAQSFPPETPPPLARA